MRPFVIWFQQRSGSSHLVSLLNSHPEIHCKGEVFGCVPAENGENEVSYELRTLGNRQYRRIINQFPGRIENPNDLETLEELERFLFERSVNPKDLPIRGIKLKFPSQSSVYPEVIEELERRSSDVKIIILHRKNYLRRALSVINLKRIQSETTKANINLDQPLVLPAMNFDVGEVVRLIRYYQSIETDFSDWPEKFRNVLAVDYDDLIANERSVTIDLQSFLGVSKSCQLQSKIQKVSPSGLTDLVSNLNELQKKMIEEELQFD